MTREEWEACTDPARMLDDLGRRLLEMNRDEARDRKLRLFACACCRRAWEQIGDAAGGRAAEAAERFADGLLGPAEARQEAEAWRAAERAAVPARMDHAWAAVRALVQEAPYTAARIARWNTCLARGESCQAEEAAAQAGLLRCVGGPPLDNALPFDPAWRTPAIVSLAEAAYQQRLLPSGELDPQRLAILADALEEASAAEEVLAHLRSPGPHVRGCFAVDLALGRG